MIVKGAPRGNGVQLGAYLLNNAKHENEQVTLLEVKSGLTKDPKNALFDMDLATEATRGRKGLYHCILNPAPGEKLSEQDWQLAVDTLEQEIGLDDQNRVIVMHEKRDKGGQLVQHVHVVWQREKDGILLQLGNNYRKHDAARQEIEVKLDLQRTRQPKDVKQTLSDLWRKSADGAQFIKAAKDQGFIIAEGERRAYKVQTPDGQVLNLVRQLPKEIKTKEVTDKLGDITLPKEKELDGQKPKNDRQHEKARRLGQSEQKNSRAAPGIIAGEKEKEPVQHDLAAQFRQAANDNLQTPAREQDSKPKTVEQERRTQKLAMLASVNFDDVERKAANDNVEQAPKPVERPLTRAERMAQRLDQFREGKAEELKKSADKNFDEITKKTETLIEKQLRLARENREDFGLEHSI